MIHIFKSISATLKIQKWLCKSRHIHLPTSGGLSEKKYIAASKNKKYNKSWKRAKNFTEGLLIYKEWNHEATDSRDYRREPFRTNQLSTKRLSLEERHCVQPQLWKREVLKMQCTMERQPFVFWWRKVWSMHSVFLAILPLKS